MFTPYKVFAKIQSMSRCLPPCIFQQALLSSQVHAARLRGSQKEVVIKVLKPGVEDILTADLSFLYVTARIMEFLNPQLSRASLVCKLYCAHLLLLFCQLVVYSIMALLNAQSLCFVHQFFVGIQVML
jgi:hypothetical protein